MIVHELEIYQGFSMGFRGVLKEMLIKDICPNIHGNYSFKIVYGRNNKQCRP